MPLNKLLNKIVNEKVNTFTMFFNYTEPKIYTGGVLISEWSKLTKAEQKTALKKDWCLYYSFRHPKTLKLTRQPHIKAGVNRLKTKRERIAFLKTMKDALSTLLQAGFNPYEDNSKRIEAKLFGYNSKTIITENTLSENLQPTISKKTETNKEIITDIKEETTTEIEETTTEIEKTSIKEAFEFGLNLKEQVMTKSSFANYKSRVNRFLKWLINNGYEKYSINNLNRKIVNTYLNEILKDSSARNRNNTRADLNTLFKTLENNELIKENFITKIDVLNSTPKRNKTFTPKLEKDIYNYLDKTNKHLLLYIKFISYSFLRPVEICRLKIEDVDIQDKKLYIKAKNQPVKIKIIPDILLKELPDISAKNPKMFLFTHDEIGGFWDTEENNKRNYFSKQFKKVKEHFNLGSEYGLYSFRHTFITKVYRKLRENNTPFETKSKLMLITGHTTMTALEKYLRDIDAELPKDYSELIKEIN